MIVVCDGSFIPIYLHDLTIRIGDWDVTAPVGFSERLGVGFNLLGRAGIFDQFQVWTSEPPIESRPRRKSVDQAALKLFSDVQGVLTDTIPYLPARPDQMRRGANLLAPIRREIF
jgi:hypothetical protein